MRNDLKVNEMYGKISFQSLMIDLKGKVTTVTFVDDRDDTIHVDNGLGFWYDESMFELAPKKPRFKVGDKVKAKTGAPYGITTNGWEGTVTRVDDTMISVLGVPFRGEFGAEVDPKYFDLIEEKQPQKIVITTDGKTTTAVLYNGKQRIKEAKATCAEGDEFNFNYGAALALSRLNGLIAKAKKKSLLNTRSQMDRFLAGEIVIEVPDGKTMDFLRELEQKQPSLRWHAGQKPTAWGDKYKYFRIRKGTLGYLWKAPLNEVEESCEIWDGVKSASEEETPKEVPDIIKSMLALAAFMEFMKDKLND